MEITWNNVVSPQRNDLVFEGRNQFYGAYEIRRNYNRTVTMVIGGVIVGVGLIFLLRWIMSLNFHAEEAKPQIVVEQLDLTPPPIDKSEPPPPPPPPPPPVMETVKFVPPVIKEDANETDPPPPQEALVETNVGTVTQEGSNEEVVVPVESGPAVVEEKAPEIFTVVEEMPEYPGGMGDLMKYLQNNISYPQVEKEAGIQGKVFVKFVVQPDGAISNVEVLRGVSGGEGLSKEAIRVVKSMPKWKPGKQNGRSVPVYFNLPINFKLN
jgi:protein TonB